jgi:hypothetical protein
MSVTFAAGTPPSLEACITSRERRVITASELPRGSRGINLIAVPATQVDAEHALPKGRYPIDAALASGPEVVLRPGVANCDKVSLPFRFPSFEKALKAGTVLVFWEYELAPDNEPPWRTGGLVVVPGI